MHLTMADVDEEEPTAAELAEEEEEEKRKRVTVTLAEKISLCIEAERRVKAEKNISWKGYCREKDIDPSQLRRWTKNLVRMKNSLENTTKKSTRVACNTGRPSQLNKIKDKLLPWMNALIAQGTTVSVRLAAVRAIKHDRSLRRMKRYTLFAVVRRFLKANGIVDRAVTHKSQEDMNAKKDAARRFLETTCTLLGQSNRHKAFIINMDQTPYNISDSATRTLAKKGSKTVNGKDVKTSLGRITAMLTVCADGTKLPPMLIYKGKENGSIQGEFKQYTSQCKYVVQENAWTDERVMLHWVDTVLGPYVSTAPKGIVPYLLLDKYSCHYQGSVANRIEELGVEWDIIPGGCTGLLQPIDVGVGRPWKNRLRYRLEDWMVEQESFERIKPKVVRPMVAQWAADSWNRTHKDIIYNAWRRSGFSYFPNEPSRRTAFQEDHFDWSDDEDNEDEDEVVADTTEV